MTNRVLGSRRMTMEILSACDNRGTNKTSVMYGSNLSHSQCHRYLPLLSTKKLVDADNFSRFSSYFFRTGDVRACVHDNQDAPRPEARDGSPVERPVT